jgi:Na+/proline symporter
MVLFGPQYADSPPHLIGAIALLSFVAVMYTLIGGIASVIWTDVIQTIVLVGASLGAVLVLLHKIPLPLDGIWEVLSAEQPNGTTKATVLELGLNPAAPNLGFNSGQNYTLLTAIFGFSLINMAAYGTDHDLAQRMLTCKSAIKGSRSAWTAILINLPITLIFMAIGALLYVYYKPEVWQSLTTTAPPQLEPNQQVFPTFILREMPQGLAGLMLAGLFAAGLGSLNSAVNAMAATFVSDFYMPAVKGRSEKHYLVISRAATIGWGILLAGFAVACIYWKRSSPQTTLIDFALQVMTFAYAGLLAVFLTAIFTRRGNTISALAALITGFGVILAFQTAPTLAALFSNDNGDGSSTFSLPKIAYPWQMLIATSVSFVVCCMGTPRHSSPAVAPAA